MAEIKDKVITAESLKALHEYNTDTYVAKTDIAPMENGGTNASDGATGLANLFAAGATVLSSYQYGDCFPTDPVDEGGNGEAHIAGRIFFKRLTDV